MGELGSLLPPCLPSLDCPVRLYDTMEYNRAALWAWGSPDSADLSFAKYDRVGLGVHMPGLTLAVKDAAQNEPEFAAAIARFFPPAHAARNPLSVLHFLGKHRRYDTIYNQHGAFRYDQDTEAMFCKTLRIAPDSQVFATMALGVHPDLINQLTKEQNDAVAVQRWKDESFQYVVDRLSPAKTLLEGVSEWLADVRADDREPAFLREVLIDIAEALATSAESDQASLLDVLYLFPRM